MPAGPTVAGGADSEFLPADITSRAASGPSWLSVALSKFVPNRPVRIRFESGYAPALVSRGHSLEWSARAGTCKTCSVASTKSRVWLEISSNSPSGPKK